jgi:N-acetylneuraminic acid mutarotase
MIHRRAVIAAGLAAVPAAATAQGRWEARAQIPWPVQEVYGTVLKGRVLIAGGMAPSAEGLRGGINPQDRTGVYDPKADAWTEGPKLPFARHHPVLGTAKDRVYAFGGYQVTEAGGWVAVKDALVIDGDAWRPVAPMPAFQCETVAVTLGGRIHVVSGRAPKGEANRTWSDQGDIALHQVFDPATARWTTASPCPLARNSATGAEIGGKLYLAGGRRVGEGNSGQLDRYDPKTDTWETLAPMPKGAGGLAGAAAGDKLYVFGGETPSSVIPDCWSYDPKSDAWTAEPPMKTPRHGLVGASIGGKVYAIGGGALPSGGQVTAVVEVLTP